MKMQWMDAVKGVSYSNPMCEWMRIPAHRTASVTGLSEPPMKGAIVRGMSPADTSLIE